MMLPMPEIQPQNLEELDGGDTAPGNQKLLDIKFSKSETIKKNENLVT